MFGNAAVSLLLFSFALLWTKVQVQGVHGVKDCPSFSTSVSCFWSGCCEMYCSSRTISCQIYHKTAGSVSWCIVKVNETLTPVINITFNSSAGSCASCTTAYGDNMCCGTSSNDTVVPMNCSTVSTYSPLTPSSQLSDEYSDSLVTSSLVTPPVSSVSLMRTHLSLTHTHFTTSTINTVSITTNVIATPSSSIPGTSTIVTVVPAVVAGTALLCLMVAAVFGTILAFVLCKTKRKQFPVTNNSDQMSQQRIDNTYSAVQITDLSSTDGVYSTLDREETTTEIPHHLNTPTLPTYSSLADVQQNTSNVEDLPLNYDMVRLENMSGSKIGVIDPYSSLAEDTSNVKELPQNYDIVRLENMSENKTGVIAQDSAEFIRVQPAPVYSTVVRQNGKKMTVKLDAPNMLVEERNAE